MINGGIIYTVLGKSRDAWARPELKPLNPREQSLGNRVGLSSINIYIYICYNVL